MLLPLPSKGGICKNLFPPAPFLFPFPWIYTPQGMIIKGKKRFQLFNIKREFFLFQKLIKYLSRAISAFKKFKNLSSFLQFLLTNIAINFPEYSARSEAPQPDHKPHSTIFLPSFCQKRMLVKAVKQHVQTASFQPFWILCPRIDQKYRVCYYPLTVSSNSMVPGLQIALISHAARKHVCLHDRRKGC